MSPSSSVPLCTSIDAIGPFDLSNLASITVPLACLLGFAFNSFISATSNTISSKLSMFIFFLADIGT